MKPSGSLDSVLEESPLVVGLRLSWHPMEALSPQAATAVVAGEEEREDGSDISGYDSDSESDSEDDSEDDNEDDHKDKRKDKRNDDEHKDERKRKNRTVILKQEWKKSYHHEGSSIVRRN
ncbi:hypothetical protein BGX26_000039 [Mortierella sp. AD094]|nr:hypothetical protein BGX26_000039 [Mortierella sp. AD094]